MVRASYLLELPVGKPRPGAGRPGRGEAPLRVRGGGVARRDRALLYLAGDEARIAQSFFPLGRGAALEHGRQAFRSGVIVWNLD